MSRGDFQEFLPSSPFPERISVRVKAFAHVTGCFAIVEKQKQTPPQDNGRALLFRASRMTCQGQVCNTGPNVEDLEGFSAQDTIVLAKSEGQVTTTVCQIFQNLTWTSHASVRTIGRERWVDLLRWNDEKCHARREYLTKDCNIFFQF